MSLRTFSRIQKIGLAAAALLLIGLVSGIGSYFGQRLGSTDRSAETPLILDAATAARSDSMSIATGLLDNNVEALFVLDHLTGNLQCWMLSPRTGAIGAIYRTNVMADLQALTPGAKQGQPDLIMATGNFFFDGGLVNNLRPGNSICYVADAKTGIVVGYGLGYNPQAVKRGNFQGGQLVRVCVGSARDNQSVQREQ